MSTNALSTIMSKAKARADANKGRLIFGFDATASRGPTWELARELQGAMFSTIKRLDVQLAVFRGGELLVSSWEDESEKLRELMNEIDVIGGNTQIHRLLTHIFEEHKTKSVNAFVFIGDSFEEREEHVYPVAKMLGDLKVPGFFFCEGEDDYFQAGKHFRKMSELTGGAYARFDSHSAKFLSDLLEAVGAFASGGLLALGNKDSAAARLLLTQLKKD